MRNKSLIGMVGVFGMALLLLACEASNVVALVSPPTPTATRTPRPTFTPRPTDTETPTDIPTSAATDTPEASPTATRRPVARATAKPAEPTATPTPQFVYHQDPNVSVQGWCDAGPSTYEVKGRVISGGDYIGGVHVVVLDSGGNVVRQMDSLAPIEMNLEEHVNCREVRNRFNYQLDLSAARNMGTLTLRLTKSAGDLTPISDSIQITIDPTVGGRWYYDFKQ